MISEDLLQLKDMYPNIILDYLLRADITISVHSSMTNLHESTWMLSKNKEWIEHIESLRYDIHTDERI